MRYLTFLAVAAVSCLLGTTYAQAQATGAQTPPPIQAQKVPAECPPGVTGPCWQMQYSQGGVVRPSGGGGGDLMAHDPMGKSEAQACIRDSDCPPGPDRCMVGYCQRGGMGCKSDTDCKYSEVCDLSHPVLVPQLPGKCAPRGGHY